MHLQSWLSSHGLRVRGSHPVRDSLRGAAPHSPRPAPCNRTLACRSLRPWVHYVPFWNATNPDVTTALDVDVPCNGEDFAADAASGAGAWGGAGLCP